jgi:signal transduction histidine kinase/DNA-binding NarL/FixJ family response regulator/HPt (histidine-containing phosphotransfer) domain-containing protein
MRRFFWYTLLSLLSAFSVLAEDAAIELSDAELKFIAEHPVIRVGVDPKFVPFEFFAEDGTYTGIASDYIAIIQTKTGLTLEIQTGLTWPQAYQKALHSEIDLLPAVGKTQEREENFILSRSYFRFKRALVMRDTTTSIKGMDDLQGKTVAVQANSSHHSYLATFPNVNISLYNSVEEALVAIINGTETVFLGNLATTDYLVRTNGFLNLKFISFDSDTAEGLYFAARKDWPQLIGIIDKVIDSISLEEKSAIQRRWTSIDTTVDYRQFFMILSIAASIIAIIFVISIYWIIRLHREIAKRKLVQQDLEQAKRDADIANQSKSDFLANMSHEIRTPMNAIIGMSDLMRTDNLDEIQRGYFNDIKKMAKSLLQIINDILDFSKIEAGKLEIIPGDFNIVALYDNICSMCRFTADAKDIEFRYSFDPAIPEVLFGDEVRIRQIITNIVNNAIKYTKEGSVTLSLRRIEKEGGDFLGIIVEDTGIGMKKEDMPKLFGVFQQFDKEKNRGVVGTGLGLSITKNLITMMNGEITVASEYGKGSVFTVQLPLAEGNPDNIERKSAEGRVLATGDTAVLVVDDNTINLTVAIGFLATHNIQAGTAISGMEAIRMVQEKRYDIIFMDHMMPEMDGVEATKRIRSLDGEWYRHVPIIALSANAVQGAREMFLEAGMDDFLSKPIDGNQLNTMLIRWLPPDKIDVMVQSDVAAAKPDKSDKPDTDDKLAPLLNELAEIKELDVQSGLSHVGGDKGAYCSILRQFCKEFNSYIADVQRWTSERNWKEYSIRLHGLKSVFANIGVASISQWALRLEQASKAGDGETCLKETEGICALMSEFHIRLLRTSLMEQGPILAKQRLEPPALREKLEALDAACRTGDSTAADAIAADLDRSTVSEDIDRRIRELTELVASFDYNIAIHKIEEIVLAVQ